MPTILIGDRQLDLANYQTDPDIGKTMGAYIVQFTTALTPPLMDLLDNELIREYGPMLADDAILCRMGTDMAKHLRATYKEIYAVAHYKPEWKLFMPSGGGNSDQPLHIATFTAYELDVANRVRDLGGVDIYHRPYLRSVRVRQFDRSRLMDLATSDWIVSISELPDVDTLDNAALPLMGVALSGSYPAPGGDIKVTGAGQIVCVADTGLDTGDANTLLPAFRDSTEGTGYGRPGDWSDPGGHGTHVAGIAVGKETTVQGVAPDALLTFQSIQSGFYWNSQKAYWASRLYTIRLMEMLEEARTTFHAGVHNNSWGGGFRYAGSAADMDTYAYEHPEMTIVVAAGNSGPDANTILSPGTAKNVITVGSCGNNLTQETAPGVQNDLKNSLPLTGNQVSDFSSRGPTKDGRIKPDVMAPGEGILSAKSTVANNIRYPHDFGSRGTHKTYPHYMWDSGTSMAAPGVAGAVALLREWLKDKVDVALRTANPSSTLIKALLINGAERIVKWGFFKNETWGGWGSPQQGWGRVNVANTISPKKDVRVWWEDEVVALENGDIREYEFTIAKPAKGESPRLFKIALVWRDPEGEVDPSDTGPSVTNPKLKNNLDLEVTGPGGVKYVGNSFNSARTTAKEYSATTTSLPFDDRNNVECVILDPVEAGSILGPKDISGTYNVRVIAKKVIYPDPSVAKQRFALVVSGLGLTAGPISGRTGQRLKVENAQGELNTVVPLKATLSGDPPPDGVPVKFSVAGQTKTVNTVNGVATWVDFTPATKGAFTIDCAFDGQGKYQPATGTGQLLVRAPDTRFTNLNPVTGQFGQNITVSATLVKDSDGTILNGKTIQFSYAGQTASAPMTADVATVTFQCTETGTATCRFAGDSTYDGSVGSIPVNPTPVIDSLAIAVLDTAGTYGSTAKIRAIYGSARNTPKAKEPLNFLITPPLRPEQKVGRQYTDSNGFAAASFTILEEPGTYPIAVRNETDPLTENYTVEGKASLTVTQANGFLFIDTNWATCHEPVPIVVSLDPATPGHTVKLTVGSETKNLVTADNGTVQYTVGPFTEETKLTIKAEFAGDAYITADSHDRELSVNKAGGRLQVEDVEVKAKTKPTLEATLTPPVKGKPVKFKVGETGTWVTQLTGDGGKVTTEYPAIATPGEYHIQVEFAGDNGITAAAGAGVLKVIP